MARTEIWGVNKPKGGLHIKGKGGHKYTIGAKDGGGPAPQGKKIVLGSNNRGTSSLMGVTK